MSPEISRRRTLKGIGAGAITLLEAGRVSAREDQRVFVHPENTQSQAIDALTAHGGAALIVYDNFDFVAGRVPVSNRQDLARDNRVSLVETDTEVYPVHHKKGHDKGGGNGNGGDDGDGCSGHPTQGPNWGYDRVDADRVTEYVGAGVDVAMLDTGINPDHCDLTVAGGFNATGKGPAHKWEDNCGHGTWTAGIAGADDNDIGVVGVGDGANLWSVKVFDNGCTGLWSYVVNGIDWCITNSREVLSMSFGAGGMPESAHTAVETAYTAGHLLVSSAGNSGNDENESCEENNVGMPARHPDVVAVSATDEDDSLAGYSSVGPEVELSAPGTDIRATHIDGGYVTHSGTSASCPFVSGTASLVWEAYGADGPDAYDRDEVRDILTDTAETVLGTCEEGDGLLDAEAAVDEAVTRP